jgi:hypothetical protein
MSYVAKHKPTCQNKDRYTIIRTIRVKENRRGVIVDNSDVGFITSIECTDCHAPAQWRSK